MNETFTLLNLIFVLSFLHDKLQCHVHLLIHCINGTSPRQIPVHSLMSLANKYLCPCIHTRKEVCCYVWTQHEVCSTAHMVFNFTHERISYEMVVCKLHTKGLATNGCV